VSAGTIRIPAGPLLDIEDAQIGHYPYDPALIRAPVMVVFGAQDPVSNVESVDSFVARFSSASFTWLVRVDPGTHVLHLERNRTSLYGIVDAFIDDEGVHFKGMVR
jgi:pimeloyl-ACP methyl ester carboxylesterase